MYYELEGDLITLAKQGKFDVITHGCNCRSIMGAGIAVPMNLHFDCSQFPMELQGASALKLGNIDYETKYFESGKWPKYPDEAGKWVDGKLIVVNSYTQNFPNANLKPIDYEALTLCLRKINIEFAGKHIGLPKIGAGLAGGNWSRIKKIIQRELVDCKTTVVIYKK